jgi:ABC-type lipoprotein export system ATPase subunit
MSKSGNQPNPSTLQYPAAAPLIQATGIRRVFKMGDSSVEVLKSVNMAIRAGEFVAIEGRSGSGKSTMLHVMGALDGVDTGHTSLDGEDYSRPTSGSRGGPLAAAIRWIDSVFELPSRRWVLHVIAHLIAITGMYLVAHHWGDPFADLHVIPRVFSLVACMELLQIIVQICFWLFARLLSVLNWFALLIIHPIAMTWDAAKQEARASNLRATDFGFVFQFYHLLPELNVLQNTLLPAMVRYSTVGYLLRRKPLVSQALAQLERVGLSHRLKHLPNQLSGGERQRVAIARALMNNPRVLFADEPTGNLDAETGRQIMDLLEKLHRDQGQTIVMVTHDRALAREADRVLVLKNGQLQKAES